MSSKSRATRVFAAFLSFNVAFGPQAVVLAQQAPVAADANTTLTQSANGTPVVNIATPNAQGVSHNRFDSYDVGEDGLILNNSAANALSLLGGGTVGNAHLANGSANLILNEVVRANAGSMLRGYQEILGPSAELVIANPWGITCNGCGFVNTPRVTLTTGRPTISNGLLAGFTITGGQLAVTGDGLDASRQSALDLLARSILVDGDIFVGSRRNSLSGDLRMFAGAHSFDYATRTGSAAAGEGAVPQFAIDSSALGGMYADRIQLLVDEHGAGVRMAGDLAALADDLTIRANGGIELRGAASAARDLFISGTTVDLSLADADTFVYGGRDLSVTASHAFTLGTGSIGGERNVTFGAASLVDRGVADDLRFAGDDGSLFANISGDLDISGGYWVAPRLRFNAANALFGPGSELQAYADTGTALQRWAFRSRAAARAVSTMPACFRVTVSR
jgi:filamentous hemagglutinin